MTDTDTELYELCKQVYEATGWKQNPNISQLYEHWDDYDELCVISIEDADDTLVPAYTSDYLLEKLPAYIQSKVYPKKRASLEMEKDGVDGGTPTYFFWYIVHGKDQSDLGVHSDTPLKALLKLTIRLHEEGLL